MVFLCHQRVVIPSPKSSPSRKYSMKRLERTKNNSIGIQPILRMQLCFAKHSKNALKSAEIDDFGLPKTCRHHPEMPCRSTFHITCSFAAIFPFFGAFVAVCCFTAKCLKPSKNCGCVTLRPSQHYARVRPQNPENVCQKPTENSAETTTEPFQNGG